MYKVLENPTSHQYLLFRDFCLGSDIAWFYGMSTNIDENLKKGHMHSPYIGHSFLGRPEPSRYTTQESPHHEWCVNVLREIIDYNKLPFLERYIFLRAAVNCTWPNIGEQLSQPHIDHNIPHYNIIVYLTGDGETFIEKNSFTSCSINNEDVLIHNPKIHDVILFQGRHYMKLPSKDRRIVLVATLIPVDNQGLEKLNIQGYCDTLTY